MSNISVGDRMNGQWIQSDFEDKGEILYFFHGKNGRQAYLAMNSDGTVEFRGCKEIIIKNIGSNREKIVVKNGADLVV
jgi:hypothetical protein